MASRSPGIDGAARTDGWRQRREQSGSAEQKPAGTKRASLLTKAGGDTLCRGWAHNSPLSVGLESRHSWGTWGATLRCPWARPNCPRQQEGPFFVSAQGPIVWTFPLPPPCASALPRDGSGRKGRTCNICTARAAGASGFLKGLGLLGQLQIRTSQSSWQLCWVAVQAHNPPVPQFPHQ